MILKGYVLINLEERFPADGLHRVTVPEGSQYLTIKIFPDAVRVWYKIPELDLGINTVETFATLKPGESIPDDLQFLDILESSVEMPLEEGETVPQVKTILFPIFYRKQKLIIS